MTAPPARWPVILGIHPTARGFGWAAFFDPFTVHDSGIYTARSNKNELCLKRVKRLLVKLKPETLVLEAFDVESSIRSARIRKLCLAIVSLAADHGVEVIVYRRSQVQEAFRIVEARTRDEIAEAVARHATGLSPYLPNRRRQWDGEDRRLSRFCAAALVLTYYHFEATQFLKGLTDAA